MATTPENRGKIRRAAMRWWSRGRSLCAFTKVDFEDAFDDADLWWEQNRADYLNSFAGGRRSVFTDEQLLEILMYVLSKEVNRTLPEED